MRTKHSREKHPLSYSERTYRQMQQSGLVSSYVRMVETDLHILAPVNVEEEALRLVAGVRRHIETYIRTHARFGDSLVPLPEDASAPTVIREMLAAGQAVGVGPMAAVAGTIAEVVGKGLISSGVEDLIVENGGDIFIVRPQECTVAVFAGSSPLSNRIGIRLTPDKMPAGICCSSGSIGHSLSLGRADAVVVTARSTALADAAATRIGNEADGTPASINEALKVAQGIRGISGAVVVQGKHLGAWGDIELVRL
ncbi:MAG: UPF0280 family protein [Desulfobulbaceae bacterium]|nr:UPF0280 family protein [Desulfobulbaceae bacterium]